MANEAEDRIRELETCLEAADRLADTIEAQIPGNSVVAREQRVLEATAAYREARVHTSDNAEDFLGELDSPEPAMKTHYDPVKEERARIRERVEALRFYTDTETEEGIAHSEAIDECLRAIEGGEDE